MSYFRCSKVEHDFLKHFDTATSERCICERYRSDRLYLNLLPVVSVVSWVTIKCAEASSTSTADGDINDSLRNDSSCFCSLYQYLWYTGVIARSSMSCMPESAASHSTHNIRTRYIAFNTGSPFLSSIGTRTISFFTFPRRQYDSNCRKKVRLSFISNLGSHVLMIITKQLEVLSTN